MTSVMPLAAPDHPPAYGEPAPMYREAPANIDVEMALLGAILVKGAVLDEVRDLVSADDFFMPAHRVIYGAILATVDRGGQATPAMLRHHLEHDEQLAIVGGPRYLAELAAAALNTMDADDYARTIADLARKRRLIDIGEALVNDCYEAGYEREAKALIEAHEAALFTVAEARHGNQDAMTIGDAARIAIERAEEARRTKSSLSGISFGFRAVDRLLGGMQPGELIVIGARPGMGKSSLALSAALNMARSGVKVAFFTLEMPGPQLARRALAILADIDLSRIKRGFYDDREHASLGYAAEDLARLPITLLASPGASPGHILAQARRLKRKAGLDLVIVDHLTIMSGGARSYQNPTAEVRDISKGLKNLALTLDLPVIALAQLSRNVESRDNKRPVLSDLRDAGTVEQDADAVLFIYRHAYYAMRDRPKRTAGESSDAYRLRVTDWEADTIEPIRHEADIIAEKVRDGETGTQQLYFDGPRTRFADLETGE